MIVKMQQRRQKREFAARRRAKQRRMEKHLLIHGFGKSLPRKGLGGGPLMGETRPARARRSILTSNED